MLSGCFDSKGSPGAPGFGDFDESHIYTAPSSTNCIVKITQGPFGVIEKLRSTNAVPEPQITKFPFGENEAFI